jgi:hypothetical protein
MKHKLLLGLVFFTGFAFSAFSQETEAKSSPGTVKKRGSGLYLDAGIGLGGIDYHNDVMDDAINLAIDNGFERTVVSIDLSIGGAIAQNLYFVGSIAGFGDRFDHSAGYLQVTTMLLGCGLRYYPFSSVNLQFGLDFGLGQVATDSNIDKGMETMSDYGYALKPSIAYDFSPRAGLSCLLGVESLIGFIEDEVITGWSIFFKLAYR